MASVEDLLAEARNGSHAAIGRLITALESGSPPVLAALGARVRDDAAPAPRIGVTGAPGVGKSSLIAAMAGAPAAGDRVGVLAVDPSSDGSGGAILGDRFRLYGNGSKRTAAPGLYFRSMGSRGSQNAISRHVGVALALLEYAGMRTMYVETAGAGQTDIAVKEWVDCLVLVLSPDSGDAIQMIKSGLMEWADVFVVNKADRAGARSYAAQLRGIARINRSQRASVHVVEATGDPAALAELVIELQRVAAENFKSRTLMWRAAVAAFMEVALVGQVKESVVGLPAWLSALDECAAGKISVEQAVAQAWTSLEPALRTGA